LRPTNFNLLGWEQTQSFPVNHSFHKGENHMGRGDKRTKKGKIFRDSYGKTRKSPKHIRKAAKAKAMNKAKAE